MAKTRFSGFTLIEILVVLSIAALLTGITTAGFSSLRNSNRKTTCQTNLTQIYQACRLYSQDYSAYPYYKTGGAPSTSPDGGIGLWALYTHPDPGQTNGLAAVPAADDLNTSPVGTYLRNVTALHCPADMEQRNGNQSNVLYQSSSATERILNRDYNSYQLQDGTTDTYASFRASASKRQLTYFDAEPSNLNESRPSDSTIITWCRFHRPTAGKAYDNVLFADGSVQWLPVTQDVSEPNGANPSTCDTWQRVPRDRAESMTHSGATSPLNTCIP